MNEQLFDITAAISKNCREIRVRSHHKYANYGANRTEGRKFCSEELRFPPSAKPCSLGRQLRRQGSDVSLATKRCRTRVTTRRALSAKPVEDAQDPGLSHLKCVFVARICHFWRRFHHSKVRTAVKCLDVRVKLGVVSRVLMWVSTRSNSFGSLEREAAGVMDTRNTLQPFFTNESIFQEYHMTRQVGHRFSTVTVQYKCHTDKCFSYTRLLHKALDIVFYLNTPLFVTFLIVSDTIPFVLSFEEQLKQTGRTPLNPLENVWSFSRDIKHKRELPNFVEVKELTR